MRILAIICALLAFTSISLAQAETNDDGTYLENLLEESLSGLGREVRVTGFRGALSSSATLGQMTIADADGVWLTLRDASLIWTRSALLRGRLEVEQLTAREIIIARIPSSDASLSPDDAEATSFAIPDLPVSVNIGEIQAENITLDASVLGKAAALSVEGSLRIAGGDGQVALNIKRKDAQGEFVLDGGFSNESKILAINLDLKEGQDGIAASLLRLPGRPALSLNITGEAPLSDYEANISLSSDNQTRLGGAVRLSDAKNADDQPIPPARLFSTDLSGDLRAFFSDELKPFFGEETRLSLSGHSLPDGTLNLNKLHLSAAALDLNGAVILDADSWPQKISMDGNIGGASKVRLPMSGPPTYIRDATFSAQYDSSQNQGWQLDLRVSDLEREEISVPEADLTASGVITTGKNREISGELEFEIDGLSHDDPAWSSALGTAQSGRTAFVWRQGAPLQLDGLQLSSGNVNLTADAQIDGLNDGLPIKGTGHLQAQDLSRFSALAERDLAGAVDLDVTGNMQLLGGAFDANLSVAAVDLKLGKERLDPLLTGTGKVELDLTRDTTGTKLNLLNITTDAINARANGQMTSKSADLTLDANLTDLSLVEPKLNGPAKVSTRLNWSDGGDLSITSLHAEGAGAMLMANGTMRPDEKALPIAGELSLNVTNLTAFSELAGRAIAGAVDLTLSGSGQLRGGDFDITSKLNDSALRTGMAEVDRLIDGKIALKLSAAMLNQQLHVKDLSVKTPQVTADITGDSPGSDIALSIKLANLGRFAPGFDGPATANGTIALKDNAGRNVTLNVNATGPGGATARASGGVQNYGKSLNLTLVGRAPLALANQFIAPRSVQGTGDFNLQISGPPALSSVSGSATINGARVALPTINATLEQLGGRIDLSGGQAQADLGANSSTGGRISIRGPIGLSPPFNATLEAGLSRFVLRDPELYQTTIDGNIRMTGPLAGGAKITGDLLLSETEIQISSNSASSLSDLPDITHINEPAAVTATRDRAGLIKHAKAPPASFPLDLTIRGPRRIFVRGQGLDAELGGQLRLTGTTANVTPSGVFELIRGRLDILGKRLTLTEGLIDLRGALDPYLRFVAATETDEFTVQVIIEGLAREPEIHFTSQPELPEEEVVARLLFGRGMDAVSPFQAAQLAAALAGFSGGGGGILSNIRGALGLSDLDVRSTETGDTEVSAGAYISDNIYSSVTADGEGRREINLNLDLSPTLTIKGRTNTDGESGIGLFFEKDY